MLRIIPTLVPVDSQLKRVGAELKNFEKPTQWLPLVQAFSQENQMMTPKMSLRRAVINVTHKDKVDALIAGKGNAVIYPKKVVDEL